MDWIDADARTPPTQRPPRKHSQTQATVYAPETKSRTRRKSAATPHTGRYQFSQIRLA